jgi:hypothetical protein
MTKTTTTSITLYPNHVERLSRRCGTDGSRSTQIQSDLGLLWGILDIGMSEVHRRLSRKEASLVLDAMNGFLWTVEGPLGLMIGSGDPELRSQYVSGLVLEVADAIRLNGYDEKWEVDGKELVEKLRRFDRLTTLALVDWCALMWRNCNDNDFWEEELSRFNEA